MRSVDVVFPASMCAMIPMLRGSSSLNALPIVGCPAFFSPLVATASLTDPTNSFSSSRNPIAPRRHPCRLPAACLPAVVRERLVRFRHAVHIFLLLDRSAARVGGVNQFVRQLVHHGLARAFPRIL